MTSRRVRDEFFVLELSFIGYQRSAASVKSAAPATSRNVSLTQPIDAEYRTRPSARQCAFTRNLINSL